MNGQRNHFWANGLMDCITPVTRRKVPPGVTLPTTESKNGWPSSPAACDGRDLRVPKWSGCQLGGNWHPDCGHDPALLCTIMRSAAQGASQGAKPIELAP